MVVILEGNMATGMHVYREIEARYGVDPKNEDASLKFWEKRVPQLPKKEQRAIFNELLSRDGEVSSEPEPPRKYSSGVPIPKLSESPVANPNKKK